MLDTALVTGLGLGSMYGLLALGYHATYAVSSTVNFAQGASMMLGAVLCFTFSVTLGLPVPLAVSAALLGTALWGLLVEQVAVKPFVQRGSNAWLMATVALGILIENVVLFTFGKDPRGVPPGILTAEAGSVAGVKVRYLDILIPATGIVIAIVLQLFSTRSRLGKAMLAVVQNAEAARLMGIRVERVVSASYMVSGLLAGVAGILIAPIANVSSTLGTVFGIKAFAVAILGGIGNARGVVAAGFIYGLAEATITTTLGSAYTQILTFSLVILALSIWPSGIFGKAGVQKV